ncbi:MAG: GNAT family N-acetyltransferase [Candidatus Blackburnbacteria bacterium]|nr:GNAT family N-acetyltransferase [Candidatus Blackburnbacteria bacterium]
MTTTERPIFNTDSLGMITEKTEKSVSIRKVTSPDQLRVWREIFDGVFPENAGECPQNLLERCASREALIHSDFYLIFRGEEAVGVHWVCWAPNSLVAYVPWCGVLPGHQGSGVYSKAMALVENDLRAQGIRIVALECEDPAYMTTPERITLAQRRLKFYHRNGFAHVEQSAVAYVRPDETGVDYNGQVKSGLMFGLKQLYPEDRLFVEDQGGLAISAVVLRYVYTEVMKTDSGILDWQTLAGNRAIREYIQSLEQAGLYVPMLSLQKGSSGFPLPQQIAVAQPTLTLQ